MADQFAVVEFQTPTSNGNVEVSSGSITDFDCAVIFISAATADATTAASCRSGVAFVTASAEGSAVIRVKDNVSAASSQARTYRSNAHTVVIPDPSGLTNSLVEGEVTSTGTDGFTLNFDKTDGNAYRCVALLFGGVAEVDLSVIASTTSSATGLNTFSAAPDVLFVIGGSGTYGSSPYSAEVDAAAGALGFVTAAGQASVGAEWDFASTDADMILNTDEGATFMQADAVRAATFTLTSTGYTHQVTTASVGMTNAVLAVRFSDARSVDVGVETWTASASTQSFAGPGFPPALAVGVSTLLTANDSVEDGSTAASFGYHLMGTAGNVSVTASTDSAAVTSNTNVRIEGLPLVLLDEDGNVEVSASTFTPDPDGFDLTFTTASSAGRMLVLSISGLALEYAPPDDTVAVTDEAAKLITNLQATDETVAITDEVASLLTAIPVVQTADGPASDSAQAGPLLGDISQAGPEALG